MALPSLSSGSLVTGSAALGGVLSGGTGFGIGAGSLVGKGLGALVGKKEKEEPIVEEQKNTTEAVQSQGKGIFTDIFDVLSEMLELWGGEVRDRKQREKDRLKAQEQLGQETKKGIPVPAGSPGLDPNEIGDEVQQGSFLGSLLGGGGLKGLLSMVMGGIMSGIALLFSPKKIAKMLLKLVTRLNPFVAIGAVIIAGIKGFVDEFKNSGNFLESIESAVGQIIEFLTFGMITKEDVMKFLDLEKIITTIKDMAIKTVSWLGDMVDKIVEWVVGIDWLEVMKKGFDIYLTIQTALIKGVGWLVGKIAGLLGFDDIKVKIDTFMADFDLGETVDEAWTWITDLFDKFNLADVKKTIGNIAGDIFQPIKDAWEWIKSLFDIKVTDIFEPETIDTIRNDLGITNFGRSDAEIQAKESFERNKREKISAISRKINGLDTNRPFVGGGIWDESLARAGVKQMTPEQMEAERTELSELKSNLDAATFDDPNAGSLLNQASVALNDGKTYNDSGSSFVQQGSNNVVNTHNYQSRGGQASPTSKIVEPGFTQYVYAADY